LTILYILHFGMSCHFGTFCGHLAYFFVLVSS
jgi:hypothetical protein